MAGEMYIRKCRDVSLWKGAASATGVIHEYSLSIYIYTYKCIFVCVYVYIYMFIGICMYVYVRICMNIHIHIHTPIHLYMRISSEVADEIPAHRRQTPDLQWAGRGGG